MLIFDFFILYFTIVLCQGRRKRSEEIMEEVKIKKKYLKNL